MTMGLKSGVRAGLPKILKGAPRLNMTRATASNNRRRSELIEMVFTVSQVWRVPVGVTLLATLIGCGGTGSPGGAWEGDHTHYSITRYYDLGVYRRQDSLTDVYSDSGHAPGNYCDPMEPIAAVDATHKQTCHYFFDNTTDATTGASTTGFNKTFAGGNGGLATPIEYLKVSVSPNSDVTLIIPSGGYIKAYFFAR